MVRHRVRAPRARTRKRFSKTKDEKGMPSVTAMMRQFDAGQRVHIHVNPSIHSAMPHRRFDGKTGLVLGMQGACYRVRVPDMSAQKEIIVHPVHLQAA